MKGQFQNDGFVFQFFNWMLSLWMNLPKETKEEIFKTVLDFFDPILRKFYQSFKGNREPEKQAQV